MKKEMMKYWSEHPIVSGLIVAAVTVFLENCVREPIIDHYFPVDTVSTFVDNYLVDTAELIGSKLIVDGELMNNGENAYRLNAAMYQICHCEAVGRGNLQHRGVMTDAPINIEILDLQC